MAFKRKMTKKKRYKVKPGLKRKIKKIKPSHYYWKKIGKRFKKVYIK